MNTTTMIAKYWEGEPDIPLEIWEYPVDAGAAQRICDGLNSITTRTTWVVEEYTPEEIEEMRKARGGVS